MLQYRGRRNGSEEILVEGSFFLLSPDCRCLQDVEGEVSAGFRQVSEPQHLVYYRIEFLDVDGLCQIVVKDGRLIFAGVLQRTAAE